MYLPIDSLENKRERERLSLLQSYNYSRRDLLIDFIIIRYRVLFNAFAVVINYYLNAKNCLLSTINNLLIFVTNKHH